LSVATTIPIEVLLILIVGSLTKDILPVLAKCPQGTINKMLPEAAQNNKREEERRIREGKRKRREKGRRSLTSLNF
jgi:hypothetical protein